jgi:hypothetical protein
MTKKGDMNDNLFCSFCGKNQKEVQKLIAGPAVYICDECIQLCSEIIEEEKEKDTEDMEQTLVPREIKEMLDDYVIEQDLAKNISLLQFIIITSVLILRSKKGMWRFKKATSFLSDQPAAARRCWHKPLPGF